MNMDWPFGDRYVSGAAEEHDAVSNRHIWLRVLCTTDIHAHLLPYDYDRDTEVTDFGLARTATLIDKARTEAPHTLLFDNGDFLQGTPLSDVVALENDDPDVCHPVIGAMNSLGYDAVSLGNHEFNFGLDRLDWVLAKADFPIVCSNVATERDPSDLARDVTLRPPFAIIETQVRDSHGAIENLKIGVIGFVPPQVTKWDHTHLQGRVHTRDIIEAAHAYVPKLRAEGAQIVLALAHTGISQSAPQSGMENAALALASVDGIDAIIAGHTHEIFPDPNLAGKQVDDTPDVDHRQGTLGGIPAVMAGYRGSHLGVLDLRLTQISESWCVTAHKTQARSVHPAGEQPVSPSPYLSALAQPAHQATLDRNAITLGRSGHPMHSYLAQIRACPALAPVLAAQKEALASALSARPESALPLLSATPPFRTGGHAGPKAYTDIPAGPLEMRHVGDLYPFPNTLVGLKLTGADVADWLERAVSCFCKIQPGLRCQPLWDAAFSGHAFDTISGVTYQIDLTQPARFDAEGQMRDQKATRIVNLRFAGEPLHPKAPVILATNNFRAFGGGPFKQTPPRQVIHNDDRPIRDLLADYLRIANGWSEDMAASWSLVPIAGASVLLETGPGLRGYPDDIDELGATDLGDSDTGFIRLDIPL